MQEIIYEKESYKELVKQNVYNNLEFLLNEGVDFVIVAFTNVIEFNPPIPEEIAVFEESVVFAIAGYTKESAILNQDSLIIEAGFGSQNFGSTLSIPLEAIFQIVYDEDILHISYYEPKVQIQKDSMQALLNNPENQKLLKKKITKK